MYRIDDATAATTLPATEPSGTEGYFTEGSPASGTPATNVRASWLNMIQEELRAICVAAGIVPTKGVNNQVLTAIKAMTSGVVGTSRNATITVPTATTTVTYTADELIVESALGGLRYCLANVNQTINIATTGAGGMASGSAPLNGFVAVYVQYNPATNTRALVGVDASGSPVAETFAYAGYSASALVGFLPTNGSGQVIAGTNIVGRSVSRPTSTLLSANTPQATLLALSFAAGAPRNAKRVKLMLQTTNTATGTTQTIDVASDANFSGQQSFGATNTVSGSGNFSAAQIDVVNTPNIFYRTSYAPVTGTPTFNIYLTGFEF